MRPARRSLLLAAAAASGCSLMPYFEEAPECGSPGQRRTVANACGVCGTGSLTQGCGEDGRWGVVEGDGCDDPLDRDDDGFANESCGALPGGCCTTRYDCNDGNADLHPDSYECTYRMPPEEPEEGTCRLPCADGGEGTHACAPTCDWTACVFPADSDGCNAKDDDCDGATDEDATCRAGASTACSTSCDVTAGRGPTGTGICTADCTPPEGSACTPPEEACNGQDDDCDDESDEDFDCVAGAVTPCDTRCRSRGTGRCSAACEAPLPSACSVPEETCNGGDDNCDGQTDETFACISGEPTPCLTSCETVGRGTCTATCGIPAGADCTAAELCNGLDDDCDEETDEEFECLPATTAACTTACGTGGLATCSDLCGFGPCVAEEACNNCDDDADGVADDGFMCRLTTTMPCPTSCGTAGTASCNAACSGWDACVGAETCNNCDDDLDGAADEDFTCRTTATRGCTTSCGTSGTQACNSTCSGWDPCTAAEQCNGCDDDGDGSADETFACVLGASEECWVGTCPGTRECIGLTCVWLACHWPYVNPCYPHIDIATATGSASHGGSTCGSSDGNGDSCGGSGSPEVVFHVSFPCGRRYDFVADTMGSNFDTVLYTSYDSPDMTPGDCSGKNRVGCDDNSAGEGQARISLWDIGCDTGSAYWLVLDGAGEMDQGAYRLNWTLTPR